MQGDPRYTGLYFNMSSGNDIKGPWNDMPSTQLGEDISYIDDPIKHVMDTNGLLTQNGVKEDTFKQLAKLEKEMSKKRFRFKRRE